MLLALGDTLHVSAFTHIELVINKCLLTGMK